MLGIVDPQEIRPEKDRVQAQYQELVEVVALARSKAPAWTRRLQQVGIDDGSTGPEILAALPVLLKSDLPKIQAQDPPFGGLATKPAGEFRRIFMSPGPIFEPQLGETDIGGFGRGMRLAGLGLGDTVLNTFSYHLTPGGHAFDSGVLAVGANVIPAGFGNTEQQVELLRSLPVNGYVGTSSFLSILVGAGEWRFEKACVAGEKMTEDERAALEAHGGTVRQLYGTADLGYLAGECMESAGMHVTEDAIIEILDPVTDEPVADGELGQIVVSTFSRDYPMLKFGTGDLSRVLTRDTCACGRTSMRLAGVLGRMGAGVKIRGMFVYEHDVRSAAESIGLERFQLVVGRREGRDLLELQVPLSSIADRDTATVVDAFRAAIKLTVTVVATDDLEDTAVALIDAREIWDV